MGLAVSVFLQRAQPESVEVVLAGAWLTLSTTDSVIPSNERRHCTCSLNCLSQCLSQDRTVIQFTGTKTLGQNGQGTSDIRRESQQLWKTECKPSWKRKEMT